MPVLQDKKENKYKRIETLIIQPLEMFFSSAVVKVLFLASCFAFLFVYRYYIKTFGVSMGYFTVLITSLGGAWFGARGGFIVGAFAILEYSLELAIYTHYPDHDLVVKGIYFRYITYMMSGIMMGYMADKHKQLEEQLKRLAHYDKLTGCVNFRLTMEFLEREVSRATRLQKPLTAIMIDLDYFKEINDTYGHIVGNEALKIFASILKKSVRTIDIVGRYGGDEFLIVLPETNPQQARGIMERVREKALNIKVRTIYLRGKDDDGIMLKFSAGIAAIPYNANSMNTLLKVVDKTLYHAKALGRDTIFLERRRWLRIAPPKRLKVELVGIPTEKGNALEIPLINVSARGMLFSCPQDVSETLMCRLWFSDKKIVSECKAKLIHKKKIKENEFLVGVFFPMVPLQVKDRLEQILQEEAIGI